RDCRHVGGPGCAVVVAIESGALTGERAASYRKLEREREFIAPRQDRVFSWERTRSGCRSIEQNR
ncbi:MAG TPA: GTPase RsgA, partial [Dehalococcoidia bacterium]|nr:GTPase RsgA [Dehalococcoidia bacterium]